MDMEKMVSSCVKPHGILLTLLYVLKSYSWLILSAGQVAKWMLSKGQGATMATYDTLLLAFDMDHRVDEAESLWNMILHTHTRSISKRLFSRMISLYDHHEMKNKIIEVIPSHKHYALLASFHD